MFNRKYAIRRAFIFMLSLFATVTTAAAEVKTNGSEVLISPDPAAGYNFLQENLSSPSEWLTMILNVVNYLVYIAAIIVVMYCVFLVLVAIIEGKRNPTTIKNELSGQEGIKKAVVIIAYMKLALIAIDVIFYLT